MKGAASNKFRVESSGDIIGVHGEDEVGDTKESFADMNDLEKDLSSERIDAKYPADCYSFISLHSPFERPTFFAFGVLVWLFQVRLRTFSTILLMPLRLSLPALISFSFPLFLPSDARWHSFS